MQQKSLKANDNQKNLNHLLTSSKCKNKRYGVCNIIREGKPSTLENLKTLIINRNLRCN